MSDPPVPVTSRLLPLIAVLFVGSGCAALIYEVVWFQILSLVIGASSVSLGVLLGTFMGGMCLGSLLLPRFVSRAHHPLRVYAALELGIGAFGLVILIGMWPLLESIYPLWGGPGLGGLLMRAAVAGVCLLPPTILMGATLPAIARWVKTTPDGVSWLGFFYGGNIVGAVLGSLLAGFVLLRYHDVTWATFTAMGINAGVALVALVVAGRTSSVRATTEEGAEPVRFTAGAWPVYAAIGLSGMTALAAEVIWFRHLSLLLGATVYTFALILAVFLVGLGIGSGAGATIARSIKKPGIALGGCQLLLCAAMAWSAYAITRFLPAWPLDVKLPTDPSVSLQIDLLRSMWAMLPAAILWGASFPLALAAAASVGQDPGKLVGGLYAANTVGAIVGALAASLLLVAWLGSQTSERLLIIASAAAGLLMWTPTGARAAGKRRGFRLLGGVLLVAAAFLWAAMLAMSVPSLPGRLVAFGRFMATRSPRAEVLYMGEGLTTSLAVTREHGALNYHNAGKIQASSRPEDMRLQRMLGHLTTLLPENRESFLVIGLGAGVTAGAVSIDPAAERVIVAEIEPLVPEVVAEYFNDHNYGVINNDKVEVHIDDGRHYLLTTDRKFDGITSDPLDPWVKGSAALYTEEFWTLAKNHLRPGGVVTVFVQLYESTEEAVKSEIATFFEVFPKGAVFANTVRGQGYDVVLVGQAEDAPIDVDRVHERLTSPEYAAVSRSLSEVGILSAINLLATYSGRPADLGPWLEGAAINRDRNLRLQYLAGAGLNLYRADEILSNMMAAGVGYPADLFVGDPDLLGQLETAIGRRVRILGARAKAGRRSPSR